MKNLKKTIISFCFSLFMLTFAINAYSQTCNSAIMKYSGPANTNQLTALLNTTDTTDYPLIVALSAAQKSSLETYLQFSSAGLPTGMSGLDSNITNMYSNPTSCSALFSEIFNESVYVNSYGNGPTITNITMAQFQQMTQGGVAYAGGSSYCFNCANPFEQGGCCYVCAGCGGCSDQIIIIGGNLYSVQ